MEKQRAVICFYTPEKGFGFLSSGTGKSFCKWFFHINQYKSLGIPTVGTTVAFDVSPVQDGPCPKAINVEAVSPTVEVPTEAPAAAAVDAKPVENDDKAGV
jgi:cold shock CspA family protein